MHPPLRGQYHVTHGCRFHIVVQVLKSDTSCMIHSNPRMSDSDRGCDRPQAIMNRVVLHGLHPRKATDHRGIQRDTTAAHRSNAIAIGVLTVNRTRRRVVIHLAHEMADPWNATNGANSHGMDDAAAVAAQVQGTQAVQTTRGEHGTPGTTNPWLVAWCNVGHHAI